MAIDPDVLAELQNESHVGGRFDPDVLAELQAQKRVQTRALDEQGITGAEVKRRAAAGEPIVQSGLRRATTSEEVRSQAAKAVAGVGEGLGSVVGLGADVIGTPLRAAQAGLGAMRQGKGYVGAVKEGAKAALSMPATKLASEVADDAEKTFRKTLGLAPGEQISEGLGTQATRPIVAALTPVPPMAAATKALPAVRMAENAPKAARTAEAVIGEEGARLAGGPMEAAAKVPELKVAAVPDIVPAAKESLVAKAKRALAPVKAEDATTQKIFRDWDQSVKLAKEQANESVRKFPPISEKEGLQTILDYEKGAPTPLSPYIKDRFEQLAEEAHANGLEFDTRANYLPQAYKNTTAEVKAAMAKFMADQGITEEVVKEYVNGIKSLPEEVSRRLGVNPSFTKERVFPNYETAMGYGLIPKYTHPAQMAAAYEHDMRVAIANRQMIDGLMGEGKIVPSAAAPAGWKPLDLNFSPKGMSAEPKLAQMFNDYFRDEGNLAFGAAATKGAAGASRLGQEVVLSAGIPYTQVNFFSIGQFIKELTAGNFKAASPFLRSNFSGASTKYFAENAPTLKKMASQGIDLGSRIGQYDKVYRNMAEKGILEQIGAGEIGAAAKAAKEKVSRTFGEAFNERVFGSFIPQLYMQTFKDAEKKFLAKGMATPEAEKAAADTVRAFYGTFENVGRGKGTEDALTAVLFAPKFREGVINALWNTGKSVTTEIRNPAFYKNRKLLAGMALTYGAYNAANMKLAGRPMWDNPPGKEFALDIPQKDGDTHVYVEFMPSFLALARNMGSGAIAAGRGDLKTAAQKFGSLASIPVKLTSEMWANSDYFGRPIYDDADSLEIKTKKLATYAGLQVTHPFIKEFIRQKWIQKDKPLYQSLSEALELPLKFGSEKQIEKSRYYQMLKEERAAKKRDQQAAKK